MSLLVLIATAGCGAAGLLGAKLSAATKRLRQTQEALHKEQQNRASERAGRIRFEQELRKLQLEVACQPGQPGQAGALPTYPFKPIGYIQSCFSQRNGTPRQPLLVPLARSRLQLVADVHASSLEGLEQYSHCWVLYIFHENTDLVKVLAGDRSGKHSKISVPRLNGGKMGMLATRSPHRPVPIGLSVAQVLEVKGNTLILGGADIVDGSPVLDIKPYVPFVDGVQTATAPSWVTAEADDEPLKLQAVEIPSEVSNSLVQCWRRQHNKSLYKTADDFVEFVKQVLSRDIRSLHKRLGASQQTGLYHVILEGVDVSYDIVGEGLVMHYILELVEKAVEQQQLHERFKPTLLVAAGPHALPVACTLKAVLKEKSKSASPIPILTAELDLYDEAENPYNPIRGKWGDTSFQGHQILVVDKVDDSRTSLANFIQSLQARVDAQKAAAGSGPWEEVHIGVFVLHNKRRPKAADLPAEVLDGRYFAAEECDNVAISYPYNSTSAPVQQPTAHGDHPHLGGGGSRKSFEESHAVHRAPSPVPLGDTRMLSSHYVDEMVERVLQEQQLYERFNPTVLVAVCDDSVAPARMLRHHLRLRSGQNIPVLTSKLDLYDDSNPYNPIMGSWASTSLSGHRILLVEKVDNTRTLLSNFITHLQQHIDGQRAAAASAGAWVEPVLGVFVLHNKDRPKQATLPKDILEERYFVAESIDDIQIAYPFHVDGPLQVGHHEGLAQAS